METVEESSMGRLDMSEEQTPELCMAGGTK